MLKHKVCQFVKVNTLLSMIQRRFLSQNILRFKHNCLGDVALINDPVLTFSTKELFAICESLDGVKVEVSSLVGKQLMDYFRDIENRINVLCNHKMDSPISAAFIRLRSSLIITAKKAILEAIKQ